VGACASVPDDHLALVDLGEQDRAEVDRPDPVVGFFEADVVLFQGIGDEEQRVFEPEGAGVVSRIIPVCTPSPPCSELSPRRSIGAYSFLDRADQPPADPRRDHPMPRMTAHDFDQELLILFDAYVHGGIDRRTFLNRAAKFAVGGVTAAMLLDQLSPKFAEAQVVSPEDTRISQEYLEFDSPDGYGKGRGYFVKPAGATGRLPGILVVHENRGLNPHIEDIARRLALANFVAFAPDALFPLGGYPGTEDEARRLFPQLEQPKTREDFLAAAGFLKARPECSGRIGAVGFCYGGGMVNYLATRLGAALSAGVPFYGSAPNLEDVPKIRCPLLIQSAENDGRINASWPDFEKALQAANVTYQRHLYPGTQHGFNNDTTPRYDAEAAKLAWDRTLAFFNRHVRS
jgi:carboxymethylenebutenolidase